LLLTCASRLLLWAVITLVVTTKLSWAGDSKNPPTKFYAQDIKSAMRRHLEQVTDTDGLFHITDNVTEQALTLKFVQIHNPVRQIGTDIYFACTDFHVDGKSDKLYDIDFWLHEENGELVVYQTKIHKEPRRSLLYGWYKHPRYTFVNDEIEYLYSD